MSDLCGALYADGVTCTLRPKHPAGWHRNGHLAWVGLKTERQYMRGSADKAWRELAEALLRGQLAPVDHYTARYWLHRLHRRAIRQEAAERRRREEEWQAYIEDRIERGAHTFDFTTYTEAPGPEPDPVDAMHWRSE